MVTLRTRQIPLLLALVLPVGVTAQAAPKLNLLPESRVWVDGTSNKNDWSVKATEMSGSVSLAAPAKGEIRIQQGGFTVPVAKMEGGRSPIMDRLMLGALKAEEHPNITYQLVSAKAAPAAGTTFTVATKGKVTLGGVTKDVEAPVKGERLPDGKIKFTGKHVLLMSDYGLTPPSAMFGALRTGNEVTVNFEMVVKP